MKKRRDILFLCQFFYPEYISSATLPFDTATRLQKEGWSVDVLCGYPKEYVNMANIPMKETVSNINIQRLNYLQLARTGRLGRLINYLSFSAVVLFRLSTIGKYKSIIVYSNPPMLPLIGAIAKRIYGTTFVFVTYDLYPEIALRTGIMKEKSLLCRVMNSINKIVYNAVDCVVALSTEMREFILENRNISPDKVIVIPNWHNDCNETERPLNDNIYYAKYRNRLVVSYFGNMGTCQDMETITNAMILLKNNPDIKFLFAGHGNKREQLDKIIADNDLANADVVDYLHGQEYLDALSISSYLIVSLCSGLTGLCVPSKVYGYMMSGVPIIVIMGDSDIVRDVKSCNIGYIIGNGDSYRLAQLIVEHKSNEDMRKQMGHNCRQLYLEKYTTDICTQKYAVLFRSLLKNGDLK